MYIAASLFFLILLLGAAFLLLRTRIASKLQALRAPLLLGTIATALPILALWDFSLARGLFWVSRGGAFGLCTLAFFIGWECLFIERVIRRYGSHRFACAMSVEGVPSFWEYLLCAVPGLTTVAAILSISGRGESSDPIVWLLSGVIVGFLFAASLVLFAVFIQRISTTEPSEALQLTPDFGFLNRAWNATPPRWLGRAANGISKGLGRLLLVVDPSGRGYLTSTNVVHDGHVAAAMLLVVALLLAAVYFAGYHWELGWLKPGEVPAAIYLYLAFTILGWVVAGLCFLLDGYGTPTLTILAAWAWVVTFNPLNQNYFELQQAKPTTPKASPAQVAAAHRHGAQQRWIIVSADGGGIQASAWSAQVLGALAKYMGDPFGNSIAMMSGVSGGSAGLMFFQTLYDQNGFHSYRERVDAVIQASQEAALSDVAFGMTFYDLSRPFLPYFLFGKNDRGVMLERAWQRQLTKLGMNSKVTLGELQEGVAEGRRPVLLFNSTVADSGQAFVLSNGAFPLPPESEGGSQSFENVYRDKDVRLVTAVRLSATFPFVSPPSKPSEDLRPIRQEPFAFVDGGYYDNYGVVNALAWLRAAVKETPATEPPPQVLWLQIRSSNGEIGTAKTHALASSGVGPLWTLYETRSAAQRSRSGQLNEMVRRAAHDLRIDIRIPQPFEFPHGDVPLSWVLTNDEKSQIGSGWRTLQSTRGCSIEALRQFVEGSTVKDCTGDIQ